MKKIFILLLLITSAFAQWDGGGGGTATSSDSARISDTTRAAAYADTAGYAVLAGGTADTSAYAINAGHALTADTSAFASNVKSANDSIVILNTSCDTVKNVFEIGTTDINSLGSDGNYLYVSNNVSVVEKLYVIDAAIKTAPVVIDSLVSSTPNSHYFSALYKHNDVLYCGGTNSIVNSYNASDPHNLSLLDSMDCSLSNTILDFEVSKNILYGAVGASGIVILDISDPTAIIKLASIDSGGAAKDIYIEEEYLYLANDTDGLRIFNISDPKNPVHVARVDSGANANKINVANGYAYLANGADGMRIFNITDPYNLSYVGKSNVIMIDLYLSGNYIYATREAVSEFYLIDVTDKSNPVSLDTIDNGGNDIVWSAGYIAFLGGVSVPEVNNIYFVKDAQVHAPSIVAGHVDVENLNVNNKIRTKNISSSGSIVSQFMSTNEIVVNGNATADTVKATTYTGDGSGLTGISTDSSWNTSTADTGFYNNIKSKDTDTTKFHSIVYLLFNAIIGTTFTMEDSLLVDYVKSNSGNGVEFVDSILCDYIYQTTGGNMYIGRGDVAVFGVDNIVPSQDAVTNLGGVNTRFMGIGVSDTFWYNTNYYRAIGDSTWYEYYNAAKVDSGGKF